MCVVGLPSKGKRRVKGCRNLVRLGGVVDIEWWRMYG
jgi:hypothetical protein